MPAYLNMDNVDKEIKFNVLFVVQEVQVSNFGTLGEVFDHDSEEGQNLLTNNLVVRLEETANLSQNVATDDAVKEIFVPTMGCNTFDNQIQSVC
jgi:hypothetical protein